MIRKMLLVLCLVGLSLGTLAGCSPPAGGAAPAGTTTDTPK